jgi:hypothetical protein
MVSMQKFFNSSISWLPIFWYIASAIINEMFLLTSAAFHIAELPGNICSPCRNSDFFLLNLGTSQANIYLENDLNGKLISQ